MLHPTSIHRGNMRYLSPFLCYESKKICYLTLYCITVFNKQTHLSLSNLQSLTCPRNCSLDCLSDHSCGTPASCDPCAAAICANEGRAASSAYTESISCDSTFFWCTVADMFCLPLKPASSDWVYTAPLPILASFVKTCDSML